MRDLLLVMFRSETESQAVASNGTGWPEAVLQDSYIASFRFPPLLHVLQLSIMIAIPLFHISYHD